MLSQFFDDRKIDFTQDGDHSFHISVSDLIQTVEHIKNKLCFHSLSNLSGVHKEKTHQIEIHYHFFHFTQKQILHLVTSFSEKKPQTSSLSHLYSNAHWLEREVFDLFGALFDGHPNLKRLLLPQDWEGHPLRKDYEFPEYYQDILLPLEPLPSETDE